MNAQTSHRRFAATFLCLALVAFSTARNRADFVGKIQGGEAWKDGVQNPVVVPVRFMGIFNSSGAFQVALNGITGRETNDIPTCNDQEFDPIYWTMSTPQM